MKIRNLEFIPESDLHKLGKYADMSLDEFVNWYQQQKGYGCRVPKFFSKIYDRIAVDLKSLPTTEPVETGDADKIIADTSEDSIPEILSFPVRIEKEAGLFYNLKQAFIEIGQELISRIGSRDYGKAMKYASAANETFPLKLVAEVLTKIYKEDRTLIDTSRELEYVREHIRNIHSKTVAALIAGDTICNNVRLNSDLIEWSELVREEYALRSEKDLIDAAGEYDEQSLSILGFDSVGISNTGIRFVIPKGKKRTYSNVADALISVFRDTIIPIGKEDVIERISHHYKMVETEDYEETFIENILTDSELIESHDGMYWLKTEYLTTDQQKMARLLFEEKNPISSKDAQIKFETLYNHRMSSPFSVLKKYGVKNLHGNIWAYSEKELLPLQAFIDNYALEHKIFYFKDLESELKSSGYIVSASVRSYITNTCQVDNNDKNHFCHKEFVDDYNDFSWRNQTRAGITNWIINRIKDALGREDEKPVSEIYSYVQNEAEGTVYAHLIRYRTQSIIDKYSGAGLPFLLKDNLLQKNPAVFDSFDFSIEGLKGGKYPFYLQIRSIILNALKRSADGKISLVEVIKLINESLDVPQDRNTVIRAITNTHLPELSVELQKIEGTLYVVRTKEDIASEPVYEIKSTSDPDKADIVETVETRPDISYRLTLDWTGLETAMKRELTFYKNWMAYEHIDFDDAVAKFIRFIKTADNRNLNCRLPQSLYEYWFARTDSNDRDTYVSHLAIFFEGLLSEIKFRKDCVRLRKYGLSEWMKEYPGMSGILTLPTHLAKGFDKLYKDLYYKRNRFAHGEMVEMTSAETAKTISDYVALYIYTVAKYA